MTDSSFYIDRLLEHPEVSDEPEEESEQGQALGASGSSSGEATATGDEEGKCV